MLVRADSVTTQYNGFGDVINGKPEIFLGSKGFAVAEEQVLHERGAGLGSADVDEHLACHLRRTSGPRHVSSSATRRQVSSTSASTSLRRGCGAPTWRGASPARSPCTA